MQFSRRRPPAPAAILPAAMATVLLTVSGVSGCAKEPDPGVVTVLNSATDIEHTQEQEFYDRCAKPLGVRVRQVSVPADQVVAKALRMASSHSLTDILDLDGSELPRFAATGGLLPLRNAGVDVTGMSAGAGTMGSFEGTRYGIARSVNSLALMYNVDLLKRAGVEPPTTWDELRTVAKRLTRGQTYGMAFSATPDADGVYQFLPFFWSAGGDESRLDDGRGAPALQLWKDLIDSGSASSAAVTWNQQDVAEQFTAGRAAMMINGPWNVPVLNEHKDLNWAVAAIPVPEAGRPPVPPIGGTVMTLPRTGDTARQKTAARIINCLNERRNQVDWGQSRNNVPTRVTAAAEYKAKNPKLGAFADEVRTGRSRTDRVGERWPVVSDALASAFQSVLTGRATPEAALERAQSQAVAAGE
ncbi:extracellular solute-binding protein [Streptomyces sp. NPDC088116]|uniref:sugar ABC transporter substrate-binding protein n=1 Tax=Streptomyces sp. NPDC088116 TaxID=3365825 RepID=UPI00381E1DAA